MQIADFITLDRVQARMRSVNKEDALVELGELVSSGRGVEVRDAIIHVLKVREQLASTGIGEAIAIPHGKLNEVDSLVVGLGRSPEGVEFEAVDGKPTRLFFVLVAPENSTGIHLKALARISRLCKEPGFRSGLLGADDSQEMYNLLCREDAKQQSR